MTTDRILFVDDDAFVRHAFCRTLAEDGYAIDTAEGAREAIDVACGKEYAVIAVDYRMPDIHGLELVSIMRQTHPRSTYILISGEVDLELAVAAVNEYDIAYVIPKPWQADDLSTTIKRSVELHWEALERQKITAHAGSQSGPGAQRKACPTSRAVINVILRILDLADVVSVLHCQHIATLSQAVGERMGLKGGTLDDLAVASLLLDVSLLGSEALDDADAARQVLQQPAIRAIVEIFPDIAPAVAILSHVDERWDGAGVGGLAADSIPLQARIVAVSGHFCRTALHAHALGDNPVAVAIAETQRRSGTQFDPTVVEVVHDLLRTNPRLLEQRTAWREAGAP